MTLGGLLFPTKMPTTSLQKLRLSKTEPGSMFTLGYGGIFPGETRGGVRTAGVFIDCSPNGGFSTKKSKKSGGTGGKPKTPEADKQYMTCTLAFADARVAPVIVDQIYFDNECKMNRFGDEDHDGWAAGLEEETAPNGLVISEVNDKIELGRGTWWQQPSARMQQVHPGKPMSAHRGLGTITFKGVPVSSIPTITVVFRNGITGCQQIVRLHMRIADVPNEIIDLCAIDGNIRGAFQNAEGPPRELIEQIAQYSYCGLAEWDGKIKDFSLRVPASRFVQVPRSDLAARVKGLSDSSSSSSSTPRLRESLDAGAMPPSDYSIKFSDIERNWDTNEAPANRATEGYFKSENKEVGIIAKMEDMLPRARVQLDQKWVERDTREVRLPLKYLRVAPGGVLQIAGDAIAPDTAPVTLMVKSQGLGRVLTMSGTGYDPSIFDVTAMTAPISNIPGGSVTNYPTPKLFIADPPILQDSERELTDGRLIVAAGGAGAWDGAALLWNSHTAPGAVGALWAIGMPDQTGLPDKAILGELVTPLARTRPDFDYGVSVQIRLFDPTVGAFADATEDFVLRGANSGLIKDEVGSGVGAYGNTSAIGTTGINKGGARAIQWTKATQIDDDVWELTGLLAGRKGTEYIEYSPVGALFLMLTDELGRQSPGLARVKVPKLYLAPSPLGLKYVIASAADDGGRSATQTVFCQGNHLKELAPTLRDNSRNTSNDLAVVWNARTRLEADDYWTGGATPIGTTTSYTVQITNAAGAILHTRTVAASGTGTETTTFLAADIAAWYGSSSAKVSGFITANGANTLRNPGFALHFKDL